MIVDPIVQSLMKMLEDMVIYIMMKTVRKTYKMHCVTKMMKDGDENGDADDDEDNEAADGDDDEDDEVYYY